MAVLLAFETLLTVFEIKNSYDFFTTDLEDATRSRAQLHPRSKLVRVNTHTHELLRYVSTRRLGGDECVNIFSVSCQHDHPNLAGIRRQKYVNSEYEGMFLICAMSCSGMTYTYAARGE